MTATVLVVDDDPVQRRLLDAMLRRSGYDVAVAETGQAALQLLTGPDGERFDAVILDLVMPELDGMGVLAALRERAIETPVIVQTANGSIETVVQAMRAGAIDFVVKPVGAERLQISLKNALKLGALEHELRHIKRRASGTLGFRDLATKSADMARVVRLAERAAKSNIPILIEGESGVGKEVLARAIQGSSDRKGKPFVTVNCGAIPHNLVESILFGHEKGSFTGATERHVGKFVEASGGTLFLDEVGEIPLELQGKLLRVLQEGQFERVGEERTRHVNVRIIAATNKDLRREVREGRFREDLYFRLDVFPIVSVPLRERPEDIPLLALHFLGGAQRKLKTEGLKLSEGDVARLRAYDWPGNVRELQNVIERAAILARNGRLFIALPESGRPPAAVPAPAATGAGILTEAERRERDRASILAALETSRGRVSGPQGAAALLGVPATTLASRMKTLGIAPRSGTRPAPERTGG